MSVYAHVDGLGELIETVVADSVLAWRREHCRGLQTVDTIAEHLTEVTTTISLRPAGVIIVTVEVKGRGFGKHEVNCFRGRRKKMGKWIVTASSLPQR